MDICVRSRECSLVRVHQGYPLFGHPGTDLSARMEPQLLHYLGDIGYDRVFGDGEIRGDLADNRGRGYGGRGRACQGKAQERRPGLEP